jgi:predicted 3-demethylubiquinone-9 3-methyltransferase (glyoxalase superfamily)
MVQSVTPFLMFEGAAEAAATFYVELFDGARILELVRRGPGGPGTEGTIEKGVLSVGGQTLIIFDSPVHHAFGFTPAVSLFVGCESEDELRRLFAGLSDGGQVLMGPADYGFSRLFTWVNDRFGVSWQLNLPHAPT